MAAFNVPDFRENSLTPPLPETFVTGKSAQHKTRQKVSKNRTPGLLPTNKQTTNQAFHDISSEIVPNS